MKKILIAAAFFVTVLNSFAQTCEERETRLLEAFGGFSAGMLYNTYGLIGSIGDGFENDGYDALTVSDLMVAQKKVVDNLGKVLEDLKKGGFLKDAEDLEFSDSMIIILKGLGKQAQLLEDYADKKNKQNLDAFENQRKQNWSAISKLMGIEE